MKKSKCRGKSKKGKSCSKRTYFYLCKSHWKIFVKKYWKKFVLFLGGLVFIASVIDLPKAYENLIDYFYPKNYIISETDNNVRGIILDNPETNGMKTLSLAFGMSNTKSFISHIPYEAQRNKYLCMLDPFDMHCNYSYRIDLDYRLFISAKLYDISGNLIGDIKDNEFILNLNNQFSWNMNDKAFEIIDSKGLVLFSLKYTPPNVLNLQGVINNFDGKYLVMGVDGKSVFKSVIKQEDNNIVDSQKQLEYDLMNSQKTLKKVFSYHGVDYFGKMSDDFN